MALTTKQSIGRGLYAFGGGNPTDFTDAEIKKEKMKLEAQQYQRSLVKDALAQANSDRTYDLNKSNSDRNYDLSKTKTDLAQDNADRNYILNQSKFGLDQNKFAALKEKAETWKATQVINQQMTLAKDGWQPIEKFPGGNPKDFQAMNIPGVGPMFKPVSAEVQAKQLIAKTKMEAFKAMDPAAQQQYALSGPAKVGAYQTPTFIQKQLIGSLSEAIKNGTYTYQNSMMGGKPMNIPIKTKEDALAVITMHHLDPKMFSKELEKFSTGTPTSATAVTTQDTDQIYNNL